MLYIITSLVTENQNNTFSIIGATEDGIIGNETIAKLNEYNSTLFRIEFTLTKIKYYITITKKRPANKKFLYGWIVRALEYA